MRRARSSRRAWASFCRSAPTAAGEVEGAAALRAAAAASFGCFARAIARASSRVTGPLAGALALATKAFRVTGLAGLPRDLTIFRAPATAVFFARLPTDL